MNLTVDEYERVAYASGNPLPQPLVDLAAMGETLAELDTLGDIQAGYPEDDFLDAPINDLEYLIESTHKNNKLLPSLRVILEALREKQDECRKNVEYGREEISKLEAILHIF